MRIDAAISTLPGGEVRPKTTQDAAQQFEALLLTQMLRTARETASIGPPEDNAGQGAIEFAEQQFAQVLAASGGLGLAKMISHSLEQQGQAVQETGT